jgi:hypothetical protein
MKEIPELVDVVEVARIALAIHNLRGAVLQQKFDTAVEALQTACPHEDTKHDSMYHSGGYDYCASTTHTWTCTLCGKVVKYEDEDHVGRFG